MIDLVRADRTNGRAQGLVLAFLALGLVACSQREIVGITSSRTSDRDATVSSPDAAERPDVNAPGPVTLLDDCLPANPANLDRATVQLLLDGTGDTASMRYLYPYDGTVYPQGISGPSVMWDGPASSAVYVRLHSGSFDYRGCLKPSAPNRLELPSSAWNAAVAATRGSADPFTLDLKLAAGETIYGPISEQLVIAKGALTGSVYYMTTVSSFAISGVMRVRAGGTAEPFLASVNCTGCHSASANGTRFLAYSAGGGASFSLSAASPVTPLLAPAPGGEFAGIYPDGSVYVAGAHPTGAGPISYGGGVMNAGLYDMATGTLIEDSGVPVGAAMPAFSPDGSELAFTDFGASPGSTLSLMRFSIGTRAATESRSLYSMPGRYAGWPAFLPDGKGVVFTLGDSADFSGKGVGLTPGNLLPGPSTDLFIVDAASHTATMLSQAMGFHSASDLESAHTYLPGGVVDLHENYYPAVSPAASGGYAWAFFDSARTYGNQGAHRAIWGTAITVSSDGTYGADPSHPAFYLPGQDGATPNFRAVPVLDP
jgi:hypothetical protein